MKSLIILSFGL